MTDILVTLGLLTVASFFIIRNLQKKRIENAIKKLDQDDLALKRKEAALKADIETIKKELAEQATGLKNMTPKQVEDYWKTNG